MTSESKIDFSTITNVNELPPEAIDEDAIRALESLKTVHILYRDQMASTTLEN